MDIKQVNSAIMFGNFTNAELSSINDAIRFARSNLVKSTKRQLTIGTSVKFTSGKTGLTINGTVNKIAIKYVTVATPQGFWKVPANMLSVA